MIRTLAQRPSSTPDLCTGSDLRDKVHRLSFSSWCTPILCLGGCGLGGRVAFLMSWSTCLCVCVWGQYLCVCVCALRIRAPAHMPFEKLRHPSIQPTRSVNMVCLSEWPGVVGLMSADEVPLVSWVLPPYLPEWL